MHRYPDYTRERLRQLAERLRERIYPETANLDELLVSERVDRITYDEAQKLTGFTPAKPGDQFGPLWATFWFRAKATVPKEWNGRRVDLLWNSHSEATLWMDGRSIQGLNHELTGPEGPTRIDAVLSPRAKAGETISFQIEMACNKFFGWDGNTAPHIKSISPYILDQAVIAIFDEEAWDLFHDFAVLQALEAEQLKDLDKTWGGTLLHRLNEFANIYQADDRSTWKEGRKILAELYKSKNATRVHESSAIGHAHIDTAWLWPLAETQRKCERTFSSQTTYMEQYPEYKFACSQAQQYHWMKERNPDLYERIRKAVKKGQFIPVGGTWIEPDCNIPSGEALARQFLMGQRFFRKEFGITCREFWNPDVFGYNGQLPQICNQSGIKRFLTNKLSWNRFNKPHHQTFIWEGIDGSEVLTHFPPTQDYNAVVTVAQLREGALVYKDHDRSTQSYILFGFGDGGGGPTKNMLERLRRVEDLQGVPRTKIRSSEEFWERLEKDYTDRVRIIGELYFEYHRGTYTTQAATKRGNRKSEFLLHDIEFVAAVAHRLHQVPESFRSETPAGWPGLEKASPATAYQYPTDSLEHLWRLLLLNQFHDILPGSSITLVYEDAERQYREIAERGDRLRADAVRSLLANVSGLASRKGQAVINTAPFARVAEVVTGLDGEPVQISAAPYGLGTTEPFTGDAVEVTRQDDGSIILSNGILTAHLQPDGTISSLILEADSNGQPRESLDGPGNQFLIYEDKPNEWQAWDVDPFHMEQETQCPPAHTIEIVREHPLRVDVAFDRKVGSASRVRQIVRLDSGARRLEFHTEVEWQESNRMLKVAFPVNVRAMNATYEMQFGNAERPTHFNTPYDLARYEVPGHKWSDLSEHGFGVSLLSESKYGFSTYGNVMRLSLLRSPKHPDPQADMGFHRFSYAIMPHAGGWRDASVVEEAYLFNCPPVLSEDMAPVDYFSFFAVEDDTNLVLDTVKKAEESDAVVLRFYECHGARGVATVRVNLPFESAAFCNILEEEQGPVTLDKGVLMIPYQPYKIISMKLT